MTALFWFTMRQILWQRRIWLTLLLLACPTGLALLVRHFEPDDPWENYHVPVQFFLFMLVVPLICMLQGTSLINAEADSGTLAYLITRRLRRGTVLVVRFVAAACLLTALVEAVLLIHHLSLIGWGGSAVGGALGGGQWQPLNGLAGYTAVAPLAVGAFLAVFTLISLATSKPLAGSVVYLIIVEVIVSNLPLGARIYSISHQLRKNLLVRIPEALNLYELPNELERALFPTGATGTVALAAVIGAALTLGYLLVTRRELVPARAAKE